MKYNLSAKLYGKGIGVKSKVKLTVGTIVDECATALAALAEQAAQAARAKTPGADTAEVPLKNQPIYFPIGTRGEVDGIANNKLEILIGDGGNGFARINMRLGDVELWVPPAAEKKRKHAEVVEDVPDGFPYAVASAEQSVELMQMVAVVILYELNAKFVESKLHKVMMLRAPDRVFVGKAMAANTVEIVPFSTSVVRKKDKTKDQVEIHTNVDGPNFQKNLKFWVNGFKESGIGDLEPKPPTYKAVSPFWFLLDAKRSPEEGSRDVRLIKSTDMVDCNNSVAAKGI